MNRPKFEAWGEDGLSYYTEELENYCDSLEERHRILVQYSDDLLSDNKELNKALDKSCSFLEASQRVDEFQNIKLLTANEWKEMVLDND